MSDSEQSEPEDTLLDELRQQKQQEPDVDSNSSTSTQESDHEDMQAQVDYPPPTAPVKTEDYLKADLVVSEREKKLASRVFGDKGQLLENLTKAANEIGTTKRKKREALWHDSDDDQLEADDVINYNSKGAPPVRKIGKYKAYLENTFHKTLEAPRWADLDRDVQSDSDDEDDAAVKRTVGFVTKCVSQNLPPRVLQFKRLKDLNRATYAEGPGITAVEFHPNSTVAVVTGHSGVATIYSIDGKKNEKLHSIDFKNFPIKQCALSKSGTEAIIGGSKKFFYTYDLMTGKTQRIFLPKDVTKMTQFEISSCGKYIAVIGRFGEVHIFDAVTKERLWSMKQEHPAVSLSFSKDSTKLFSHSCDAEVTVFNMNTHTVSHRFWDEGCVNGSQIAVSPSGELLATGSNQGVVNIYDLRNSLATQTPKPLKAIMNLTTAISSIKFNSSSEILAMSSKSVKDAVKMVHFPSGSVYTNFPGNQGKLGKPTVLSFSPQSGYFAIGNVEKEVPLFRLKHFNNY